MPTQSISFESNVFSWIESEAKRSGHTISFMVNFFCNEAKERKNRERPQMLTCPKHTEAMYSSKLPKCPLCAEEETIHEIDSRDNMIKNRRAELLNEKEQLFREIEDMTNKINCLDLESEGAKEKNDKLNSDLDKMIKKRNAIIEELGGLI